MRSRYPRRWFARVEWKPQDCWIGVFWRQDHPWTLDVWICLLPLLPIHFGWRAQIEAPSFGDGGDDSPAERNG